VHTVFVSYSSFLHPFPTTFPLPLVPTPHSQDLFYSPVLSFCIRKVEERGKKDIENESVQNISLSVIPRLGSVLRMVSAIPLKVDLEIIHFIWKVLCSACLLFLFSKFLY
jgi:hypothetical protein